MAISLILPPLVGFSVSMQHVSQTFAADSSNTKLVFHRSCLLTHSLGWRSAGSSIQWEKFMRIRLDYKRNNIVKSFMRQPNPNLKRKE